MIERFLLLSSSLNATVSHFSAHFSFAYVLFNYVYTGQVEITPAKMRAILIFAKMMQLSVPENWTTKGLANGLPLETLAVAEDFSRCSHSAALREICISLMQKQYQRFVQSNHYIRLPADAVLGLLGKEDGTVASEEGVFAAISSWMHPYKLELQAPVMLKTHRRCQTTEDVCKHVIDSHQLCSPLKQCGQFRQFMTNTKKDKPLSPSNRRAGPPQTSFFLFGKDKGLDSWSVVCFDSELQRGEGVADMGVREYASYSVVGESIFAVGGWMSEEDEYSTTVKEFVWRQGRWYDRAPLAVGRRCHADAVMKTCRASWLIGVFGGFNGNPLTVCELYDTSQDSWCSLPDLRHKRSSAAAACLHGDRRFFVFGGWNGSAPLASVEFCALGADCQEEGTNAACTEVSWQPAAPMRSARSHLAATQYRGQIIVAGGYDGERNLRAVEMFTPPLACSPLGQWTELADMRQPRRYFILLTSGNAIFAFGNQYAPRNTVERFVPPAGSVDCIDDLTVWNWTSKYPVEILDTIWGAASIRM